MFTRGSFRYPYIVRLMGTACLLVVASVAGLRWIDDGRFNNSTSLYSISNEWLLIDSYNPPGLYLLIKCSIHYLCQFDIIIGISNLLEFWLILYNLLLLEVIIIPAAYNASCVSEKEYFVFKLCGCVMNFNGSGSMNLIGIDNEFGILLINFKFGVCFLCVFFCCVVFVVFVVCFNFLFCLSFWFCFFFFFFLNFLFFIFVKFYFFV